MNRDTPIAALRKDLLFQTQEEDGQTIVVLSDPKGYANQAIAFPEKMVSVLLLLNGKLTLNDLSKMLFTETGEQFDIAPLENLFEFLDYGAYLESPKYFEVKEDIDQYLQLPVRPPLCANSSYSDDQDNLTVEIDSMLASYEEQTDGKLNKSNIIIAPHLDYRTGKGTQKTYASAYKSLETENINTFVIFGTSHYVDHAMFMLSSKDFETPLGIVQSDTELIEKLKEFSKQDIVFDEPAHRYEHSIELQIPLIQRIMDGKEFKILPILTGSYFKYIINGQSPADDPEFHNFKEALGKALDACNRKPAFIAAADMAHIGRKFEDPFDAETELERLESEDKELIKSIEKCDADDFLQSIASVNDKNKICGLSPIYTLLKITEPDDAELLKYHQWSETETKSAVTIASMSLSKA